MDDTPQINWHLDWAADTWQKLTPYKAAQTLVQMYGHRAGEEALLRAQLAERYGRLGKSHFWVTVYRHLRIRLKARPIRH